MQVRTLRPARRSAPPRGAEGADIPTAPPAPGAWPSPGAPLTMLPGPTASPAAALLGHSLLVIFLLQRDAPPGNSGVLRGGCCPPHPCRLVSSTQGQPRPGFRRAGGEARASPALCCCLSYGAGGEGGRTAAPAAPGACAGDLLESGSGLMAPWHGPETPLCM